MSAELSCVPSGVVQQKVLGIIPSSTAAGSQTYTTLQPRTNVLNIRASTPGAPQQVRLPGPIHHRAHNLWLLICCAGNNVVLEM